LLETQVLPGARESVLIVEFVLGEGR